MTSLGLLSQFGPIFATGIGLAAGFLLGLVYFSSVRRSAELLLLGEATMRAVLVQGGRLALAAASLFAMARLGALPLLAATLGFTIARHFVLRRAGATS